MGKFFAVYFEVGLFWIIFTLSLSWKPRTDSLHFLSYRVKIFCLTGEMIASGRIYKIPEKRSTRNLETKNLSV